MINKLISFILTVIMSITGLGTNIVKSVFNNTLSLISERSDFLEEISSGDIYSLSKNSGYIKDIMLVFFEDDASFFERLSALLSIDGTVVGSLPEANLCVVNTNRKNLDGLTELCENAEENDAIALASVCPVRKYEEQYTPNDPFDEWFENVWDESNPEGYNWHLEAIEARSAWGYSNYFNHINIGVVDSGFATEHEDIKGKIIFPSNREEEKNEIKTHGTAVAGIIGAIGDNEKGVYGICQNSTMICVNWEAGWISALSILFGFGKVVKSGAKIVNMSIGSSGALNDDEWYWMNFLNDIEGAVYSYYMGSLLKKGYDFLVVQSSGNGNGPGHAVDYGQNGLFCTVNEKSMCAPIGISEQDISDRIIIVGACFYKNGEYTQSEYSNVGDGVDIVAPGDNIKVLYVNGYTTTSGTSFAAPIVSAVASLVWSVNESFTGSQVRQIVLENTKHTAKPNDYYKFEEYLNLRTLPVVNAKLAVEAALKLSYEMNEVYYATESNSEVKFINAQTNGALIFETNADGNVEVLLEAGTYDVYVNGEFKENLPV